MARAKRKPAAWQDIHGGDLTAERAIAWCEKHLVVPEGMHVGKALKVAPFMREDFRAIIDNPAGTRRAIITRGRKNSKSTECAMLVLLFVCGPFATRNGQIYSTAQSRDQAALVFSLAAKMVRMSPTLRPQVVIKDTAKELHFPALGTMYKALSAESSTAFGRSPVLHIVDELGQTRGPRSELYEAMETATAAQENPLTVIISTQAPSDADLLSILIDDAQGGHDPRTVLRMDTAPMDIDPFTEEAIRYANPAFDLFMNKREVLSMAADAKRMPAREAEFRNLVLNQRVEANNPFVTRSVWQACGLPPDELRGRTVYGGLDLSSVADLTALVLIGQSVSGIWSVKPTFWLPADGLTEKSRNDRVPYDVWNQQGFLQTTPGKTVSYEYVAHYLKHVFHEHHVAKLAFDRWNMKHLQPWLLKAGFSETLIKEKFVEFGQGTQSMSPALRDLEGMLLDKKIAHGNHPVLSMCAACAVVEGRDDANRKLSKNKSTGRIDGLVALAMACGVAPMQPHAFDVEALIA